MTNIKDRRIEYACETHMVIKRMNQISYETLNNHLFLAFLAAAASAAAASSATLSAAVLARVP